MLASINGCGESRIGINEGMHLSAEDTHPAAD
jgi:hypothetical protein